MFATLFRWSPDKAPQPAQVIAAMLGMAGPILLGALTGQIRMGMAASMGGLALSGGVQGDTWRAQARYLALAVAVGSAALLTGNLLGRTPVATLIALPVVAALAGGVGGISRPLVMLTTQFIIFTTIAVSLGTSGAPPVGSALFFAIGAACTACAFMVLERVFRWGPGTHKTAPAPDKPPSVRKPTVSALLKRWRGTLRTLAGWQFAIRLGSCLAAAEAVAWVWPWHHAYWIALTVAITLERRLPAPPTRVVERLIGTGAGVLLAGGLMLWAPPVWALIGMIAVLAAARPILRAANYTAYATIMTPLIILLLDFDQPPSVDILVDRLAGTAVGCGITLVLGYGAWVRFGHVKAMVPDANAAPGRAAH